jgi:Aminoglycoside-2''-adenylyltransferase
LTPLPTASDQLSALAGLHQLLQTHTIAYWLFGGWAVDFHAGRVTRAHGDLDIAVWSDDRGHLDALLKSQAWAHTPEADEDGYTCYELGAVRLEVAFLARDDRGCVYTPLREGRAEWPDEAFGDDVAELLGVQARLVRRGALIAEKSVARADPATSAKDRVDVQTLTATT